MNFHTLHYRNMPSYAIKYPRTTLSHEGINNDELLPRRLIKKNRQLTTVKMMSYSPAFDHEEQTADYSENDELLTRV